MNKQYYKKIKKKYGKLALWKPGETLSLGDVGTYKNGKFVKEYNLQNDFGIHLDIFLDKTTDDSEKGTIDQGISLDNGIEAQVPYAKARIRIGFKNKNDLLFQLSGIRYNSIDNWGDVKDKLKKQIEDGRRWDKDWIVVHKITTAEAATIIMSKEAGVNIELEAQTDAPIILDKLGDAKLKFVNKSGNNAVYEFINSEGCNPLFEAVKLRQSFLDWLLNRKPDNIEFDDSLHSLGTSKMDESLLDKTAPPIMEAFETVDIDDL